MLAVLFEFSHHMSYSPVHHVYRSARISLSCRLSFNVCCNATSNYSVLCHAMVNTAAQSYTLPPATVATPCTDSIKRGHDKCLSTVDSMP